MAPRSERVLRVSAILVPFSPTVTYPARRFIGLSGNYFSLQYLSVSDATVLQFLAPMCTGIAGALLLKEHFSREQAFASRKSLHWHPAFQVPQCENAVFSLVGVVLIARPSLLFGQAVNSAHIVQPAPDRLDARSEIAEVTPAQRLSAVGYITHA